MLNKTNEYEKLQLENKFQHFYAYTYFYITGLTISCYLLLFLFGFLIKTVAINKSKKEND